MEDLSMKKMRGDQFDEVDDEYAAEEEKKDPELRQDAVDNRRSFPSVNSMDRNSSQFEPRHNITASDNNSFSDNKDITSRHHIVDSNAEQSEGDEDIKEEENAVTQSVDDRSAGISGSRKSRTRWWPPLSDPQNIYPSLRQRKADIGQQVITLGRGQDSGRNRLAIFQDTDDIPRLAFNIRVEGRTGIQWKGYPSPSESFLPVGTSLSEILAHYPNHVWNDGLRLFMAEGWQAEKMWNVLPKDARNDGASTRKWNYLQQALGREADKIGQEQFGEKRVPDKRTRRGEPDGSSDVVASNPAAAVYRNSFVGGLQTASQGFPPNNSHAMTSHASGFPFISTSQDIAASGADRGRGRGQGGDGHFATTSRGPTGLAHPDLVN